jgi:predicted DNA-binding protein YlxM (UPF0122 family)
MKQTHENISHKQSGIKNNCRNRMELLSSRVDLLTGKDKLLMTMYIRNGNSFRQMARLAGVNEAHIARRIRKIMKRLLDDKYITCLRNRDQFTTTEMTISKDYFLLGLSIKKITAKRHFSYYRVRQTLQKIKAVIKQQ